MTAGHKHRQLSLRRSSWRYRLLTKPVLAVSDDLGRVDRSRFVWKPYGDGGYCLSPLGFLHPIIGLEVVIQPEGHCGDGECTEDHC